MGTPYRDTEQSFSEPARWVLRMKVWLSERNPAPSRLTQELRGRDAHWSVGCRSRGLPGWLVTRQQDRTTGRVKFLKADQALVEEEVGGSQREGSPGLEAPVPYLREPFWEIAWSMCAGQGGRDCHPLSRVRTIWRPGKHIAESG